MGAIIVETTYKTIANANYLYVGDDTTRRGSK